MGKQRHHFIENLIYTRTKQQMNGAITKGNWHVWESKWFETAEVLKKEFKAEGLIQSFEYVAEIIAIKRKLPHQETAEKD